MTAVALAALAFVLALVAGMIECDRWGEGQRSHADLGQWAGRIVWCAVAVVVSTLTWTAISPEAILVVVLVGATTPPAADVVRTVLTPAAEAPDTSTGTHQASVELLTARHLSQRLAEAAEAMSDAQLCRAWRESFWTLRESSNPVEQLAVVLQRQSFLDELDARYDAALQEWIDSGARESGGPDRFLNDGGGQLGGGAWT